MFKNDQSNNNNSTKTFQLTQSVNDTHNNDLNSERFPITDNCVDALKKLLKKCGITEDHFKRGAANNSCYLSTENMILLIDVDDSYLDTNIYTLYYQGFTKKLLIAQTIVSNDMITSQVHLRDYAIIPKSLLIVGPDEDKADVKKDVNPDDLPDEVQFSYDPNSNAASSSHTASPFVRMTPSAARQVIGQDPVQLMPQGQGKVTDSTKSSSAFKNAI